jgi:hypothetical protein
MLEGTIMTDLTTVLSYDHVDGYRTQIETETDTVVSVTLTSASGRKWRGVRADFDSAVMLAGRMLLSIRAAQEETKLAFTIASAYLNGSYLITLMLDGDGVRRYTTAHPAVIAAAAYMLEKAPNPVELGDSWGSAPGGTMAAAVSLDQMESGRLSMLLEEKGEDGVIGSVGNRLVMDVRNQQRAGQGAFRNAD